MSGKREILFLAHRIPYPPNKGDKIRSWRLVEHLAQKFRLHLCAFVDDPADFAHEGVLNGVCESVFLAPLDPRRARARSVAGFFTGEPLSFPYFRDSRMKKQVEALRSRDLAAEFAFSSSMAPYISVPGGRPRIVDLCDADSEKWRQYARDATWPMRLVYAREGRRLAAAETQMINWADLAFAASPAEAAILNNHRAGGKCDWFGNGVDAEFFSPRAGRARPEPPADVVFVGAMDYRANVEAVLWFASEIWPRVRERRGEARFAVVGARPVPGIRALDGRNGMSVTGTVEDVRPFLQHARVAVAPLRVARGVQNKVLEAMAMARPVVATSGAVEGIEAKADEEILVADEPEPFAAAVVKLLADPKRGDAIGASARARMKAAYAWRAQFARLDAAMARLGLAG